MQIKLINFQNLQDNRGSLSVIEDETLPFDIKRIYYLYQIPNNQSRGGHAHKEQKAILIAISGSFEVTLNDGFMEKKIILNNPNQGLFLDKCIWREIHHFSKDAICLVLSSDTFDETDYIRDYNDFLQYINQ